MSEMQIVVFIVDYCWDVFNREALRRQVCRFLVHSRDTMRLKWCLRIVLRNVAWLSEKLWGTSVFCLHLE